jgi:flagellar protein FliO/FliZ
MSTPEIIRIVFGFIAVLGMIGACAYVARKAGLSGMTGMSGKKRRLAVSEMISLDARRRLAIIRCDDTEHLVILGASGETLIAGGMSCAPIAEGEQTAPVNPFAELTAFARKLHAVRDPSAKEKAA